MIPCTKDQMKAYSEAACSGQYEKQSGLQGKYDNVRRFWEDEITRIHLRPHLMKLIRFCRNRMKRIRIMDLGCGCADGFDLLTGVRERDPDLQKVKIDLLSPDILGLYKGVDLNEDLLRQADEHCGSHPKVFFEKADFTQGLPMEKDEAPFDLYFSSFGTCSHHNDDATLIQLLVEIVERTPEYCIVVCDWLGRYSYEWQSLWTHEEKQPRNMDYVVSYIYYDKDTRDAKRNELQHLSLRLMSRDEVAWILKEVERQTRIRLNLLDLYDRSIFTGRHMDTGDYNSHAQPIRGFVNSLHEDNTRTDLSRLLIDYSPRQGFPFLNGYFEGIQMAWNTLIQTTMVLMESYDTSKEEFLEPLPACSPACPPALRMMMDRMRRIIQGVGWLNIGLPRENIIEPQLGYALRYIVDQMQEGIGAAHGLVGILEIDKS